MRRQKILCTLGPSSLDEKTIRSLDKAGVDIFRLNLSHTRLEKLESQLRMIRENSDCPICLDTEGAQVRTGWLDSGRAFLKLNSVVCFSRQGVVGNAQRMNLYPPSVYDQLVPGDFLDLDFGASIVQVLGVTGDGIDTRVLSEGYVGQNKAVSIDREIQLPALTQKDRQAIEIAMAMTVEYVALSFASSRSDVESLRELVGQDVGIISKIENLQSLQNLAQIMAVSDAVLIDRGDLAREMRMEAIPFIQKWVIQMAQAKGVPVYVATNLLESMVTHWQPNRAEVNDVMNTLVDGADGLVLAAETAIGTNPLGCLTMVDKLIRFYGTHAVATERHESFSELFKGWSTRVALASDCHSDGLLVHQDRLQKLQKLPQLSVDERVIMDAEQIALGTFAPLDGFMTEEALRTVLNDFRLPNGEVWPLPVLLQIPETEASHFQVGDEVLLVNQTDSEASAILTIRSIFSQDLNRLAREWYGTDDSRHPGVHSLMQGGKFFLGGPVQLLHRRATPYSRYEFVPSQTRRIFESRGWTTIVGFHTRNVVHQAHEKLLRLALERTGADGVLISPVVGAKKTGEYEAAVIIKSYEMLLRHNYLPESKVLLGVLSSYSRYGGPREAVFTALCRRNLGCTHFIVGRDHTGVGNFYEAYQSQELFKSLGDIGIEPIFFEDLRYCCQCDDHVHTCVHLLSETDDSGSISGTQVRTLFRKGKTPPRWMMRPEVADLVLHDLAEGKRVFVE